MLMIKKMLVIVIVYILLLVETEGHLKLQTKVRLANKERPVQSANLTQCGVPVRTQRGSQSRRRCSSLNPDPDPGSGCSQFSPPGSQFPSETSHSSSSSWRICSSIYFCAVVQCAGAATSLHWRNKDKGFSVRMRPPQPQF